MSSPDFTVGSTWPSLDESKAGVQASRLFRRADREEKDRAEKGSQIGVRIVRGLREQRGSRARG